MKWKNYGDVNPLEHGGIFVQKDAPTSYYIVKTVHVEDEYQLYHLYVDITDGWLDKKAVMSDAGLNTTNYTDIQYAIACTEYYSYLNFGSVHTYDKKHLVIALEDLGIMI